MAEVKIYLRDTKGHFAPLSKAKHFSFQIGRSRYKFEFPKVSIKIKKKEKIILDTLSSIYGRVELAETKKKFKKVKPEKPKVEPLIHDRELPKVGVLSQYEKILYNAALKILPSERLASSLKRRDIFGKQGNYLRTEMVQKVDTKTTLYHKEIVYKNIFSAKRFFEYMDVATLDMTFKKPWKMNKHVIEKKTPVMLAILGPHFNAYHRYINKKSKEHLYLLRVKYKAKFRAGKKTQVVDTGFGPSTIQAKGLHGFNGALKFLVDPKTSTFISDIKRYLASILSHEIEITGITCEVILRFTNAPNASFAGRFSRNKVAASGANEGKKYELQNASKKPRASNTKQRSKGRKVRRMRYRGR